MGRRSRAILRRERPPQGQRTGDWMTAVRCLQNLHRVLNSTDGESDHCWERLRWTDRCYLRSASEPQPIGAGGPTAWRATLNDDAGRKLSWFPGRNRWPGADSEYAQTGREIWRAVFLRRGDRLRSGRQAY